MNICVELEKYLNRPELVDLSDWQKELLRRFVRRFGKDCPVGRTLALALIKLNKRNLIIDDKFISWLYYY